MIVVGSEWIIRSHNDLTLLPQAFTWDDQQSLPITVLVAAMKDLIAQIEAIGAHLHLTMREVIVPIAAVMIARAHGLILLAGIDDNR